MDVYVDTSAFLAVLDADDKNHEQAKKVWKELLTSEVSLICSSYVLVETYALVQNRLGIEATRVFHEDIYHLLQIEWVEKSLHMYGINSVLIANRRSLSLVDCVSFVIMRKMGIKKVFTFDTHFVEQGFECI
ncbi:MAG TPA: VapC toxin family PIN domain ribonuclease [Desulfotomaculum sp.]|nr:VapC toxin family PIN domain ribonuclease [Desulfotomaculum sp.]HCJ79531.1 VapC toxin family PIN domain ribonuclease [Desulfotomaculum sp.]